MSNIFRKLLVFVFLYCGLHADATPIPSESQISLRIDSSELSVREPEKQRFKKYYSEKEFDYQKAMTPVKDFGLWMRFWQILGNYIEKLRGLLNIIPLLYYFLLVGIVLLFLFILISRTKIYRILYSQTEIDQVPYQDIDSDELVVDIDKQIEIEIQNQNYRKAIRLMFIKLLNRLESRHLIQYSKGKTNFDYQSELAESSFLDDFKQSVVTYEYVWYGNFQIDGHGFKYLSGSFKNLFEKLND